MVDPTTMQDPPGNVQLKTEDTPQMRLQQMQLETGERGIFQQDILQCAVYAQSPITASDQQQRQQKMMSTANVVGVVIFLFVGVLTLNELIPSKFEQEEHASRKLASTREGGLDWRNMNRCALIHLGKQFGDDKFVSHTFGDLYCETMAPFRGSRVPLRMLEIGFGCGHHNHGKSALGKG